jgi:uncharacterized SAM-binding protein YcdF (DUF218 family)
VTATARSRFLHTAALILVVGVFTAWLLAFRGIGRWLDCEDRLAPADAIVVLSGGLPWRAEEAAKVYQSGYAHEIWVSRPDSPAAALAEMGVHYINEDEYDREILIHEGVPDSAIHVFPDAIVDTEQEVEEIAREMQQQGKARVIIVSSPYHTRRVRKLWRELVTRDQAPSQNGGALQAIVHGAPEDPFDANHWWRTTRDAFSVAHELMGLANAWMGLPIRPHTR